jgi:uncharacterized membrane protein HdeD (DUF308 family)
MLPVLARYWDLWLFRASIALVFGIFVLVWPVMTPIVLVFLFSAWAAGDGLVALIVAFASGQGPGIGSLLFEGTVRLGAGLAALIFSGPVSLELAAFLAVSAGLSGIAAFAEAVTLRKELAGEWPLPIAGALSLLVAVALMMTRGGDIRTLVWLIGPYSIFIGLALTALAFRLRKLSREIASA